MLIHVVYDVYEWLCGALKLYVYFNFEKKIHLQLYYSRLQDNCKNIIRC